MAVLAVDPTSPYTGGALLGDRVRMQEHATDPGVFIRSMATRGHLGGMALAAPEAVRILDAAGYDRVVVETVGVGQAEVDVAAATDTAVVVLAPGLGDAVQMAKAGILEIADVFVVNKADRDGAPDVVARAPADAAPGCRARLGPAGRSRPPHSNGEGIEELWDAIEEHRDAPGGIRRPASEASGAAAARGREPGRRAVPRERGGARSSRDADLADELAARRLDPYRAAAMLVAMTAERVTADRRERRQRRRPGRRAPDEPPAAVDVDALRASRSSRRRPATSPAGTPSSDSGAAVPTRSPAASTPRCTGGGLWTMRQFAGFGTAAETNARYRFLLEQGQGGLSVAFDMPTLMGLDSDDPRARGRGRSLRRRDRLARRLRTLFDGIPLGRHHAPR